MIPHLADARRALAALLERGTLHGVDAVYDNETDRECSGPCYVTVAVEAVRPTEIVLAVRVYSQIADGTTDATETLETAVESVDDRLAEEAIGPSEWQIALQPEIGCMVARCLTVAGRETF